MPCACLCSQVWFWKATSHLVGKRSRELSLRKHRRLLIDKGEADASPLRSSAHYWWMAVPVSEFLSAVRMSKVCAMPVELKFPNVRYAPMVAVPSAPLEPETE